MRGIFLALLVFNIVAFAWSMLTGGSEERTPVPKRSTPNPYTNIPELVLLSEIKPTDPAEVKGLYDEKFRNEVVGRKSSEKPSSEEVKTHDGKPLCALVGPFKDRDKAGEFIERLTAIEIKGSVKDIELPSGAGYWVYLAPSRDRKEALRRLNELQSKGVDSYVIPKGELENGISLGMFSQKSLADARLKEMESIGLEPKLQEIERSYREIWVMLDQGEDAKMNKFTWQNLLEETNMLERRQNYCLDVASK